VRFYVPIPRNWDRLTDAEQLRAASDIATMLQQQLLPGATERPPATASGQERPTGNLETEVISD
jgi:hypothetical protein